MAVARPAPALRFTLDGTPIAKGRPRLSASGATYTPARTRAYEEAVGWAARAVYRGPPLAGAVCVHVTVRGGRGDLDNVVKAVLDALNGIAFGDDTQVEELHARVDRAGRPEGISVAVMPLIDSTAS